MKLSEMNDYDGLDDTEVFAGGPPITFFDDDVKGHRLSIIGTSAMNMQFKIDNMPFASLKDGYLSFEDKYQDRDALQLALRFGADEDAIDAEADNLADRNDPKRRAIIAHVMGYLAVNFKVIKQFLVREYILKYMGKLSGTF